MKKIFFMMFLVLCSFSIFSQSLDFLGIKYFDCDSRSSIVISKDSIRFVWDDGGDLVPEISKSSIRNENGYQMSTPVLFFRFYPARFFRFQAKKLFEANGSDFQALLHSIGIRL